ncbi:helix-hairpin-helix domain-containing protein [Luteimonas deserti]|uniref:Helix-hairpin-helix domain-containing protein n=1 Tax=Luteimonas deserti TaxID=2752306 RepID=A0A7Z0QUJ3_9GAMM|nr:helix-hairpin-helix domain-containing protein [Luteimonas deserti]NYZ63693.1 helix-hairpin-helix domain-containing protein [Luteimonas deserti]
MAFGAAERALLLGAKGVGPTVISRLEQIGYSTLAQLSKADATEVTAQVAAMLGTTCWRNSPQARAAISAAIDVALSHRDVA